MKLASMLAACGSLTAFAKVLGLVLVTTSSASAGQEAFKLLPGDGAAEDFFGRNVAIHGRTAIVGALGDDGNGNGPNSGSAYLFDVTTGLTITMLKASDGSAHDRFGSSVGISATAAIVGADSDDDNGSDSGSAYLFDVTTGIRTAKLLPGDGAAGDRFGLSVGIAGNTAIVGAPSHGGIGPNSGSAYLFDVTTGLQIAQLLATDGANYATFGYSVAINGSLAMVGAPGDDDNGAYSGSVYVFDLITGQQLAKLLPTDGESGDRFGISVAINDSVAIVGAEDDDDQGHRSGSAYLFDLATWQQTAKLLPDDGAIMDRFGRSVAISDSFAVVGVHMDDDNGLNSGSAYLFTLTSTGSPIGKLLPSDGAADDLFGFSVGISGNTAVVGAASDNDNGLYSGSAYLFAPLPPAWVTSPVSGHWYVTVGAQSWVDAQTQAELLGGHLATVRSQAENDWLLSTFASTDSLWIGYTDQALEGTFEWIGGDPVGYENWALGEPDDGAGADWAVLQPGTGLWTDEALLTPYAGVVELISDDCNGDGSPDVYQISQEPWRDWDGDGVLDFCVSPNYCTAVVNSTGFASFIGVSGTPVIADNDFTLYSSNLPLHRLGYFFMSQSTDFVQGFGNGVGNLCLGTPIIRLKGVGLIVNTGFTGAVSKDIDLTTLPQGTQFLPGDTWYFQLWYREVMSSNTTDGIEIMFR